MYNWFLQYGDKLLAAATTFVGSLEASGVIKQPWATPVLAGLTFIHNSFLPEPTAPVQSFGAK